MRNYRLVIGFSAFGFLLSLISGFVAHSKVGVVFLHALLFAVVFAFLGFLLEFVFEHVLQANLFSSTDSPVMEGALQGAASGHGGAGHKVDFYVEDEDLPSENESPRFVVSYPRNIFSEMDEKSGSASKRSMHTGHTGDFSSHKAASTSAENDTSSAASGSSAEQNSSKSTKAVEARASSSTEPAHDSSSQGFVPISLGETPSTISGTEAKKIEDLKPVSEVQTATQKASHGSDDEELDELPDMGSFGMSSPSYSSGGVVSDDDGIDGESAGNSQSSSSFLSNEDINEFARGQDTQLMAKAISTLLANE